MPKTFGTAGPRLIMPTICTSVPLASCPIEAQLLFERLITQADDQGRLQGEARVVAALCMPLIKQATERSVRRWLGELATAGLVIQYVADGRELIQLAGWWDNQGTPRRAYPSRYPAPNGWTDRVRLAGDPPPTGQQSVGHLPTSGRQSADNLPQDDGEMSAPRAPARVGANPSRPYPTRPSPMTAAEKQRHDEAVQRTLAEISKVAS